MRRHALVSALEGHPRFSVNLSCNQRSSQNAYPSLKLRFKARDRHDLNSVVITSYLPWIVRTICKERLPSFSTRNIAAVSKTIFEDLITVEEEEWPHVSQTTAGEYVSPRNMPLDPTWSGQSSQMPFYRAIVEETTGIMRIYDRIEEVKCQMREEESQATDNKLNRRQRRSRDRHVKVGGNLVSNNLFVYTIAQESLLTYARDLFTFIRKSLQDFTANRNESDQNGYDCEIFKSCFLNSDRFETLCGPESFWNSAFNGLRQHTKKKDAQTQIGIINAVTCLAQFINNQIPEEDSHLRIDLDKLKDSKERLQAIRSKALEAAEKHKSKLQDICTRDGISYDEIISKSFKELADEAFTEMTGYKNLHHMRAMKTFELIAEIEEARLADLKKKEAKRLRSNASTRSHITEETLEVDSVTDDETLVAGSCGNSIANFDSTAPKVVEVAELDKIISIIDFDSDKDYTVVHHSHYLDGVKTRKKSKQSKTQDRPNTYQAIIERDQQKRDQIGMNIKPNSWSIPSLGPPVLGVNLTSVASNVRRWSDKELQELKRKMSVFDWLDESFYDEFVRNLLNEDGEGKGSEWFPQLMGHEDGSNGETNAEN